MGSNVWFTQSCNLPCHMCQAHCCCCCEPHMSLMSPAAAPAFSPFPLCKPWRSVGPTANEVCSGSSTSGISLWTPTLQGLQWEAAFSPLQAPQDDKAHNRYSTGNATATASLVSCRPDGGWCTPVAGSSSVDEAPSPGDHLTIHSNCDHQNKLQSYSTLFVK